MAKKKGKKVKEMSQTHGMVEAEAKESEGAKAEIQPTTLDQIWGDTGEGKYKTLDLDVYKGNLSDMGKSDLHGHAVSLGLIPIDNTQILRKRLVREFCRHVAKFNMPAQVVEEKVPVDPEIEKILAEGR